jgi:flagellar hook-associated protein 2
MLSQEAQVGISSPGIGSNLDVNGIIDKLMQAESTPFVAMQQKEQVFTNQLSAYGQLSGALGALQTAVTTMSDSTKYRTQGATSSDSTIVTANASKDAIKGAYGVTVSALAQSQSLMAAGQASTTSLIGDGTPTTLTFDFGGISGGTLTNGVYSGATFTQDGKQSSRTVTIDGSNNSLQGIRDAINKANIGVRASIISDGSANPNRLVFTASDTGATSNMKISVAGDSTLSNLLSYAPDGTQNMTQTSAGQDAALTLYGVNITSHTNTVSDAIPGVTLNLAKIGAATVNVTSDTSGVKTALTAFVKAYNDLNSTIATQTKPGAPVKAGEAPSGGPLLGDATTRNLQSSLRRMFSTAVPGLDSSASFDSLSDLGVTFQKDGSLKLDTTKLQKAVDTDLDDVTKLLATSGSTSDSLINFVSSTSSSGVGTKAVTISQLATQGNVVGGGPAALTITAGVNDQLAITVNGIATTATLQAGTYTPDSLAALLQASINGASGLSGAGAGVTVTQNAGVLTVSSNKYGSTSTVALSGTAADALLPSSVATTGVDVAGTIGGAPATGSGQMLTGAGGSDSAGIQLEVKGGTVPASRGTVTISKGMGAQFTALIDSFLGPKGSIPSKNEGINNSLNDLSKQKDQLNTRLTAKEAAYRKEFTALDVMMGQMSSTSSFLTQQLAQLATLR